MVKEMKNYIKVDKLDFVEPIDLEKGITIRKDNYKETRVRNFDLPIGHAVYIFFNKSMEIMYIGKTNSLKTRLSQHINQNDSKVFVSREIDKDNIRFFTYALCKTKKDADAMEMIYIHLLNPKLNDIPLRELRLKMAN